MKTYTKPAASKLVARFDSQLKKMLSEDLKAYMEKSKFLNNNIKVFIQPLPAA